MLPLCCVAFQGARRIAAGDLAEVAVEARRALDRAGDAAPILIFDGTTNELIEVDLRGTPDAVRQRIEEGPAPPDLPDDKPRGPGRPKLGVVGREVTLLPQHWQWLNTQPGGASVALRKLVEEARRVNAAKDRVRFAREAAYRFMSVIAGDFAGFEEATRALFAGKRARFDEFTQSWPTDIRDHARRVASPAFEAEPAA
jgi:hypothetical protein